MIILKILFWAIIALLGLFLTLLLILIILTLIPARILVKYKNGEVSAVLKYLFLKIDLLKNIELPQLSPEPKTDTEPQPSQQSPSTQDIQKTDTEAVSEVPQAETANQETPQVSEVSQVETVNQETPQANEVPQAEAVNQETPQAETVADTTKSTAQAPKKQPKPITNNKIIDAGLDKIGEILSVAGTSIRWFFKSIKFKDIVISFHVNGDDAAKLAISYGKTNAMFFSAISVLQNVFRLKFKRIDITPNFENTRADEDIEFSTEIVGTLFSLAVIAIWAIVKLYKEKILFPKGLPFFKKRRRKKKKQNPNNIKNGGIKNERQSTTSGK